MKKFIHFFLLVFFFLTFSATAFAQSSYVLPYPSSMPGSLAYKFHLVFEEFSRYWYFGDFGQFSYSLKMADKYLVEAKTLFEYKQYLLGDNALKKSDIHFVNALSNLVDAGRKKKDIVQKRTFLNYASQKHIEVLEKLRTSAPDTFVWQPEKAISTTLYLKKSIENSIKIRKTGL